MSRAERRHAFTDGLSRREQQDVTPDSDGVELGPIDVPEAWTPEHVARRLVEAFETLADLQVRVGPRGHANAWPAMLQEFADLTDADALQHARDAFARARRRPSADAISRMDEALSWPMRHGAGAPLLCDAALIWAWCKARSLSIRSVLRFRVTRAKALADNMTIAANERQVRDLQGDERAEGSRRIKAAALSRHDDAARELKPVKVQPHEAMPEKVLSRTTLDRRLPEALALFAMRLAEARVTVR